MAEKVLGLAGPGRGPWVYTVNLTTPYARIVGLASGSIKIFGSMLGKDIDAEEVCIIDSNGRHPLRFFPFLRVVYEGSDRSMVLTFCEGARRAVPST